jgi:hypothetical protein
MNDKLINQPIHPHMVKPMEQGIIEVFPMRTMLPQKL